MRRTLFLEDYVCDKTLKEKNLLKFTTATGDVVSSCRDLPLHAWDEQGCKMSSSGTLSLVHKLLMAAGPVSKRATTSGYLVIVLTSLRKTPKFSRM